MAFTAPKTWTSGEDVDFNEFNTHIRDNFNATAVGIASAAGRLIVTSGANALAERVPTANAVATSETTTSTTYTDLTTAGPAVTVTTGTAALVSVGCLMGSNTVGEHTYMGFAVSGATTMAADDSLAFIFRTATSSASTASRVVLVSGLTAGSNTFTAKYRVSAGTGSFQYRRVDVIPF